MEDIWTSNGEQNTFLKIDDLKTNIKGFKKGIKRNYGILIKDLYVNLAVIIWSIQYHETPFFMPSENKNIGALCRERKTKNFEE